MKTPDPDHPIRNTLKHLALASAMGAAMYFGASPASAAPPVTTDLKLHLDASQFTGLSDNDPVPTWTDMSGGVGGDVTTINGIPYYKAAGIGGLPTVHFDNGDALGNSVNYPAPVTIFYVSRQTGGANARVLAARNNNWLLGYWGGSRGSAFYEGDVILGGNGGSDTDPHLYATTIGGGGQDSTVWAEGIQIASNQGGTQGPNGIALGGGGQYNEFSDCEISEVLIYGRILDSSELDAVGGYLTAKYGLTTTYPTGLTVRLNSPANNDGFVSGTSVSATASVVSGTAPYTVKFFTRSLPGGTFAQAGGDLTTPPYTLDLGALSDGSYEIQSTVTDSADPLVTAISATHTFLVAPATATTTTVASSVSPSTYGDDVTFTATVTPTPTGGTVQFLLNGNPLGTPVAVNGTGEASVTTSTLGVVGPHEITAEYSGYQIYDPSTTAASITQVVNKAGLTVTAVNMLRLPNTPNPEFLYLVTGFKNGENLGTSDVSGTPDLTTTAILASPLGDYPITSAVGTLASDNYSFVTFEPATLTVADVADTFGVNFHADENDPLSQIQPGVPAGFGDWLTPGWKNHYVPFGVEGPYVVPLTSNKGSSATFTLIDARNGGTTSEYPRTTNLGDGNYSLMAALAHGTSDAGEPDYMKFDMTMTGIPFTTYDVIFYFGSSYWNGNRTGKIEFNGAAARAFTLQAGAAYDGTFTEMVDGSTPGNYIVYPGVTGASFTAVIYGDGFNHLGPTGFQIRNAHQPATITSFGTNVVGSSAVIGLPVEGVATIDWTVPYASGATPELLAALAPEFTLFSGTCTDQISGVAPVTPDFSAGPVTYTVTDDTTDPVTTNVYTVTVTVLPPFTMALTGDGTTGFSEYGGEADGFRFQTLGSDLAVNWLGFYDAPNNDETGTVGDGLLASHRVSIWLESDGSLVAQTTVLTTDALEGNFRGNNITPVTLTANTGYVIAADYGGGDRMREGDDLTGWGIHGIAELAGRFGGAGGEMPTDEWAVMVGPNFGTTAAVGGGYTGWAAANAPGQTPEQDHDNDGVENGIEYFMGETGSSFTPMPGLDATNKVSWTMDPNFEGTYEVQTSPDLVTWTNVDPKPVPSGGSLSYTLPTGMGKQFVRLLVTPAP
ncbi:MAG: Ig-like domain repeat protein [Akkermansiaceae bacterium]|nr:Ig-like domain repeat protein [Akkermansiaceae bacterium]MCF7730959.1 Ig-like domain repeat protein [Akkermansiaceae bacterium]